MSYPVNSIMGGNQGDSSLVCLICLEFKKPLQLEDDSNSSSSTHSNNTNKIVNSTKEFVKFCKTFLQTEVNTGGQLWRGLFKSKEGPSWGRLYFCKDCEVLVKNVLRLHSGLNVIKARMFWKVNELRKVISQSQKSKSNRGSLSNGGGGGEKGDNNIEHLTGSSYGEEVEKFRKNLMLKCTEKSRMILPFVVLNKIVNKCTKGKRMLEMESRSRKDTHSICVPSKSDLDFVISFIIVLALKRNWSLREIAAKQTEFELGKLSFSRQLDNADGRLKPTSSSVIRNTAYSRKVKKRIRGKSLVKPDSVPRIKEEISSVHEDSPEASGETESSNTSNLNYDDEDMDDRNSDVSMNFSESNFNEVEITNLPDVPIPAEAEDNKLLPNSETDESVTLGRGRGRSITSVRQEPVSGDDSHESDKQEFRPPRKVIRRRKLPTKEINTKQMNNGKIGFKGSSSSQQPNFKCNFCNKQFRSFKARRLHRQHHRHFYSALLPKGTQEREYRINCEICQERCLSSLMLFDHLVNAHDGGPDKLQLHCKICKFSTGTIRSLLNHLRQAHENPKDKSHFCPNCTESYTTPQRLEVHRRLDHWKLPPLFCDDNDCAEPFFFVEDLNSHMREHPSHQNREMFHCEVCNRGFFSNFHLSLHKIYHLTRDEKGMIDCPDANCWRKYHVISALQNHFNTTHFSFEERVNFYTCPKRHKFSTFSKGEFDFHTKQHGTIAQYKYYCDVCEVDCTTFTLKNYHVTTLAHLERAVEREEKAKLVKAESKAEEGQGESETTPADVIVSEPLLINCGICEENFTSQAKRQLHRKKAHGTLKRKRYNERHQSDFICEVCAHSFVTWSALQRHMLVHAEPQLQCPYCKKFYRRDYTLKTHINRKHTQKDMHVCDVCGKACPSKSEYNFHKSEHLLLHCCHLCPKKFSRGWSLKVHMRVHTGEKLQCEWCPVTYAALENMKCHVKESHPEEYQYHYGTTKEHRTSLRFRIVKPTAGDEGGDRDAPPSTGMESNPGGDVDQNEDDNKPINSPKVL